MKLFSKLFILICLVSVSGIYAASVSLRDKISQMLIIGFDGKSIAENADIVIAIEKQHIGGVVLFDYNQTKKQFDKNIESPQQLRKLAADLQQLNDKTEKKSNRPPLPLLISIDYEGGDRATRLQPSKGFPKTQSAATIGKMDFADVHPIAEEMSDTLKEGGINLNFAPVVDVNVNPESPVIGRIGRSFSEDPVTVAAYASIYSKHYLDKHIQCAYKHFPGHGSATGDSHEGFVDVSETWQPKELEPYKKLFGQKNACGMVMTAHIVNRQLDESASPATLSYKILTDLLRKKLLFNGVIITDDLQMKAISEHYSLEQVVVMAVNAGADMLLFGNQLVSTPQDPKIVIDLIESKVKTGEISAQRIDDAYQRIVGLKETLE
jgi:beta-N-acetylhexosaminidase